MQGYQTISPLPVSFSSAGICLLESHHRSDFYMPVTSFPFWVIIYVLAGKGRIETSQTKHAIEATRIAIIPPGVSYRVVDDQPSLGLYALCLQPDLLAINSTPFPQPTEVLYGMGNAAIREMLRELLFEARAETTESVISTRALAQSVFIRCWRMCRDHHQHGDTPRDRVAVYSRELKRQHFVADTIDSVADRLGISRRHFTELFRELNGVTWQKAVNNLRLQHAEKLLLETTHTIRSIAFECGFNDLSHFHRAFRQRHGLAPGRWRTDHVTSQVQPEERFCEAP